MLSTSTRQRRGPNSAYCCNSPKNENGLILPVTAEAAEGAATMTMASSTKKKKRKPRRWNRVFRFVGIILALLLLMKSFFPDIWKEINIIVYHGAMVLDVWVLRKQRRQPAKKIIYYLHISKCGGTSIMTTASQSGLSVPTRNGLVQRDWRCCGNEDSLRAQQHYASTNKLYDFVANEGDMYQEMDTEHYDYVVTLRQSRSRYKSMWAQWSRSPIISLMAGRQNFTEFCHWFHEDNFNVRKICGTRCRSKPKFQLTEEDLHYTMNRLQQFDSILFLEDFDASYMKFANKHGWNPHVSKKRSSSTFGQNTKVSTGKSEDDDVDGEWDIYMSALDDALYEYALALDRGMPIVSTSNSTSPNYYQYISKENQQNLEQYFKHRKVWQELSGAKSSSFIAS